MRLDELVNAPNMELYHFTDTSSFRKIIAREIIKGEPSISLTRNRFFDISTTYMVAGPKPWRIGLNYQKLKRDYKITPFRDYYLRSTSKTKSKISLDHIDRVLPNEFEERIEGDIFPLFHYMSSLGIDKRLIQPYLHPKYFENYASLTSDEIPYEVETNWQEEQNPYQEYELNTQHMLYDIINALVGTEQYVKKFGKKRKSGFSLDLPIFVIDIDNKKHESIEDYIQRTFDLEIRKGDFVARDDEESTTKRFEKSAMFSNKTKRLRK